MNDVEKNIFPCKSCLNAVDYTSEIGLVTMIIFFSSVFVSGYTTNRFREGKVQYISSMTILIIKVYGIHPYCDLLSKLTNNIKYNFIGA